MKLQAKKPSHGFRLFDEYFGNLVNDKEGTLIYGFENFSKDRKEKEIVFPDKGGVFGYVQTGSIIVHDGLNRIEVSKGFWFSTRNNPTIEFKSKKYRFSVWQKEGYQGLLSSGLVEDFGRLKYIDGCMDTILASPIKEGQPCLNALYMPEGVNQTMHTHPSTRSGFIVRGGAKCDAGGTENDLLTGQIFYLKSGQEHKFKSDHAENIKMSLVAYHPDSDYGPTDEKHPMINRTIVDGKSASDIAEIQTK